MSKTSFSDPEQAVPFSALSGHSLHQIECRLVVLSVTACTVRFRQLSEALRKTYARREPFSGWRLANFQNAYGLSAYRGHQVSGSLPSLMDWR